MNDVYKFTVICCLDTCKAFFGSNISQARAKKAHDDHMDMCHEYVVGYKTCDEDNTCTQYQCMAGADEDGGVACNILLPGNLSFMICKNNGFHIYWCPNTFKSI